MTENFTTIRCSKSRFSLSYASTFLLETVGGRSRSVVGSPMSESLRLHSKRLEIEQSFVESELETEKD